MSDDTINYITASVLSFEEIPPSIGPLKFLPGYSKIIVASDGNGPHLPLGYWEIDIFKMRSNHSFILRRLDSRDVSLHIIVDQTYELVDYDVFEKHSVNVENGKPIIKYVLTVVLESEVARGRLHFDLATITHK